MTNEQQRAILDAAERLIVAYDALRSHDADTIQQYQFRPTICPRTGRAQQAFHTQPQERKNRKKDLIQYRDDKTRKLLDAIRAACIHPTREQVQKELFGTA
jgi:hypothetical protein